MAQASADGHVVMESGKWIMLGLGVMVMVMRGGSVIAGGWSFGRSACDLIFSSLPHLFSALPLTMITVPTGWGWFDRYDKKAEAR